ncbi:TetR family transcriptional regulator [Novosphingobium cyanobacteriorum]|uniref:TetR family transcriptional regulator n=1 Tax=Novosphingobium cyanobacteriorum TaxID=3024215 RepID=A0ABT6CE45_9SPHN|nr:TetR family transcriptional regulator [Novosphingobium cyanobacteriorum]MDF8332200.1 TetR family transcriptional regulator [Novosphingobium cyanobacteriorum]
MAVLPAREDKESSRNLFLRAAGELMTERGSLEVSLSDIAQKAQLNSALVKYYFGSKDGLLLALTEHVLSTGIAQLQGLLEMDISVLEKLKIHINGITATYLRYPFVNRLIHLMMAKPETGAYVAKHVSRPLAEAHRRLLEEGVAAGVLVPINPMMFHLIVVGACDQLFFGQHVLKHAFDVDRIDEDLRREYTRTLLDLILNGLLVHKS